MIAMPQFGAGIGPPATPQPEVDFSTAMMQRARDDALRQQVRLAAAGGQEQALGTLIAGGGRILGTTISRGGVSALSGDIAQPAAKAVTSSATSGLASDASSALGYGAAAYSAYAGALDASNSIHALNQALASGSLTKQQEEEARQKLFNAGMVKFGVGSSVGLASGALGGPVGGIVGAAAGGYGGAKQAWESFDNPTDYVKAFGNFISNPFKR